MDEEISKFWIFGQNGQGDLWLFDIENKVCFLDLNLTFEKWLQFADLNKQLDYIYDTENELDENQKIEYKEELYKLSKVLFEKYPFDI